MYTHCTSCGADISGTFRHKVVMSTESESTTVTSIDGDSYCYTEWRTDDVEYLCDECYKRFKKSPVNLNGRMPSNSARHNLAAILRNIADGYKQLHDSGLSDALGLDEGPVIEVSGDNVRRLADLIDPIPGVCGEEGR